MNINKVWLLFLSIVFSAIMIAGDKTPKNYESAFRSIEPKKVIEKTLEILDTAKHHHN